MLPPRHQRSRIHVGLKIHGCLNRSARLIWKCYPSLWPNGQIWEWRNPLESVIDYLVHTPVGCDKTSWVPSALSCNKSPDSILPFASYAARNWFGIRVWLTPLDCLSMVSQSCGGHWAFTLLLAMGRQSVGIQQRPRETPVIWEPLVERSGRVADSEHDKPTQDNSEAFVGSP